MATLFEQIEHVIRDVVREEVVLILGDRQSKPAEIARPIPINNTKSERLLKANEVAELMGVSVQRVYELARQHRSNQFPVIKIGDRQYRFSRPHIYEWLYRTERD